MIQDTMNFNMKEVIKEVFWLSNFKSLNLKVILRKEVTKKSCKKKFFNV
jgi:hypothetical protein